MSCDTSPDTRTVEPATAVVPYASNSLVHEAPSEFSLLVNRMHAIFTQFKVNNEPGRDVGEFLQTHEHSMEKSGAPV